MNTVAFKSCSGGILGRPLLLDAAANVRLIDESTSIEVGEDWSLTRDWASHARPGAAGGVAVF